MRVTRHARGGRARSSRSIAHASSVRTPTRRGSSVTSASRSCTRSSPRSCCRFSSSTARHVHLSGRKPPPGRSGRACLDEFDRNREATVLALQRSADGIADTEYSAEEVPRRGKPGDHIVHETAGAAAAAVRSTNGVTAIEANDGDSWCAFQSTQALAGGSKLQVARARESERQPNDSRSRSARPMRKHCLFPKAPSTFWSRPSG